MKLVLEAPRLIDGTGQTPVENAAILIEDGIITAITNRATLLPLKQEGCQVIAVEDGTIMPGFIEMHSHIHCSAQQDAYHHVMTESNEFLLLRAVQAVRSALSSGVTTMRDLGSKNDVVFPIRSGIKNGLIPGPRLLASGCPITTTGGHCNMFGTEADSSDEVLKAIRHQFKQGADCIKIISTGGGFTPGTNVRAPQYDSITLQAAVTDAERLGLPVAAHCHGTTGIKNCVKAGIHNLIHCSWFAEDPEKTYDYDPNTVNEIAEKGLYVDPTIALRHLNNLRGRISPGPTAVMGDPTRRFEILRDMWDRGVKFVTGLDSGMTNAYFNDFAFTPEVMVSGMGISPMQAIVCSTRTSAECLNIIKETGTLERGKSADILIINGDPLADITALHNVNTIVKAGQIIKQNDRILI